MPRDSSLDLVTLPQDWVKKNFLQGFSTPGEFCPELVSLSCRAINKSCNLSGSTLILPNMCDDCGREGKEGGAEAKLREERVRWPRAKKFAFFSLFFPKWKSTGPFLVGRRTSSN